MTARIMIGLDDAGFQAIIAKRISSDIAGGVEPVPVVYERFNDVPGCNFVKFVFQTGKDEAAIDAHVRDILKDETERLRKEAEENGKTGTFKTGGHFAVVVE